MDDEGSDVTERLPNDLLADIRSLDEQELRTLVDFAQRRLREIHPAISEQIDQDSRQDILKVEEEEEGLAKVLRRDYPGAEDHQDAPVLYLVTEERTPEDETRLHWTYLGPVQDS